jgi:dual specificity tyrosine-phosphorylation-regulated kinase 2/3/4
LQVDIWSLGAILAELSSGQVLFQNDSCATLLARLEGILGPLPRWMVSRGRYANRYYTRRWGPRFTFLLQELLAAAPKSPHSLVCAALQRASRPPRLPCSGHLYEKSPATERFELLLPKRTSLRHRVPDADEGLLAFVSYLLHPDPMKRPSAAQALGHPWLAAVYPSDDM